MQEISKQNQQVTSTINLEVKTDKLQHFLNQRVSTLIRWSPIILGFILLGTWVSMTISSGSAFTEKVIAAAIIIGCLLILRGPNSGDKVHNKS